MENMDGDSTDNSVDEWLAGKHPHQAPEKESAARLNNEPSDQIGELVGSPNPGLHMLYVEHGGAKNAGLTTGHMGKYKPHTLLFEYPGTLPKSVTSEYNRRGGKYRPNAFTKKIVEGANKYHNEYLRKMLPVIGSKGNYPESDLQIFLKFIQEWINSVGITDVVSFDIESTDKQSRLFIQNVVRAAQNFVKNRDFFSAREWLVAFAQFNEYRESVMIRKLKQYHNHVMAQQRSAVAYVGAAHSIGLKNSVPGMTELNIIEWFDSEKGTNKWNEYQESLFVSVMLDWKRNHDIQPATVIKMLDIYGLRDEAQKCREIYL